MWWSWTQPFFIFFKCHNHNLVLMFADIPHRAKRLKVILNRGILWHSKCSCFRAKFWVLRFHKLSEIWWKPFSCAVRPFVWPHKTEALWTNKKIIKKKKKKCYWGAGVRFAWKLQSFHLCEFSVFRKMYLVRIQGDFPKQTYSPFPVQFKDK